MDAQEQKQVSLQEQIYNIVLDVLEHWLFILGVGIAAAIIADIFITVTYTPRYRTEATFVIKTTTVNDADKEMEEIAESIGYIIKSNVFMNTVKEDIGVKNLNGTYDTSQIEGTNMIKVSAEADSSYNAYLMMTVMMDHYTEISQKVIGDTQINIIEQINIPRTAYNQISHLKNLMLFGAAGTAAMILFFAALSYMRDTVKGKKDITEKLQIRMLGSIVREGKIFFRRGKMIRKKSILITQLSTSFTFIEGFRRICSRLRKFAFKHGYRVFMVTSSVENEGKSSVILNMALSMAKNDKKVLVVDMDFRKPAVYKIMDFEENDGLMEVIEGKKTWREAVFHDRKTSVDFLLKKDYSENAPELLELPILKNMLAEARKEYDFIFLDSAPVSYMSDASILARIADAVILTVRQNYIPVTMINRAINKITTTKAPIAGAVLNRSLRKGSTRWERKNSQSESKEAAENGR